MIIARSPLRISLGGGGTDLASYYEKFGGFFISAAIDKYVYLTIHKTFSDEMILKYSQMERVHKISDIQHPIIRESLRACEIQDVNMEITSMADLPSGTGLGSSGSFTTAFLKALMAYKNTTISQRQLAELACEVEIGRLKEPIGKQDQYIAAYGGITCFKIDPSGAVEASPLKIPQDALYQFEDGLLLMFTGYTRSASSILREQDTKSRQSDQAIFEGLHFIKDIGVKSKAALENGDIEEFARLMNVHWEYKKKRSSKMSNEFINECYDFAMANGALGGKLIGAGGGGFLLFYAKDKIKLRKALVSKGLKEVRLRFDTEGTKILAT